MRRIDSAVAALVSLAALALAGAAAPAGPGEAAMPGFSPAAAEAQRALEARLDAALDPALLRDWMKRLTARPHHVGSPGGRESADTLAGLFREWGFETRIEEYQVLFPTPKERLVELVSPARYRARLAEPALPEDATSVQAAEQLPLYNAYSADGDVTAPLVYVNYGVPKDYEELDQRGIDVKGKIVIARYGGSWRGIKPKVAAERGAVGCLIYSDPRDDGYVQGDAYPKGAWRGEWGAQRGSVADMPVFPGDPLTPGVAATRAATRLRREDAPTLTKVPVLPIAHGDALPLLRALSGPVAPEAWRGALPITYHLGPGPATVRLKVSFDWSLAPARNVIAVLGGAEKPDQWVIRGNHHDAWVNGADDPVSGLVALLAEARAVGALARAGARPRRTIVYAAWDAEEPGLLGSTEWAEDHAEELRAKAVAYVNSDSNGRGFLQAGGSHSLERLVDAVARDVRDPQRGTSVAERRRARLLAEGTPEERKEARERPELRLAALGSGSDYTPFLQHLGIASLNLGFGGEDRGGSYHSIYDSFDHYTRFGDPGFGYGVALAQTAGRVVLRLANAQTLPFDFTAVAAAADGYAQDVAKLADDARTETEEASRLLRDGTLQLAADPREPFVAPSPRPPVPYLNLAPLRNAVARLQASARAYREALDRRAGTPPPPEAEARFEAAVIGAERLLTAPEGLPGRPWYRHLLYAPGAYTGYGVKTLPGVREAIELRRFALAEQEAARAASRLEALAAAID
ncbi:MAG TPA: M28 family metallopeptidase, partial [Vicinamibacteria bacterium]|nr:M28 family metallopeptidase [Vicinamibacteria bacterium]